MICDSQAAFDQIMEEKSSQGIYNPATDTYTFPADALYAGAIDSEKPLVIEFVNKPSAPDPEPDRDSDSDESTVDIPEENVPLSDVPEPYDPPVVEIPDEAVPLSDMTGLPTEILADIPDEAVPLADVPKTGDASAVLALMSCMSGLGAIAVSVSGKKKTSR